MNTSPTDHPGVYIPPPALYAGTFLFSLLLQRWVALPTDFLHKPLVHWIGIGLIGLMLCLVLPALLTFLRSRNTVITNKPAHSLQTHGVYAISRNPMYLGLFCLYTGLALLAGNSWTLLLIPLLVLVLEGYVIKREEHYLERTFGSTYQAYKQAVRRWI